MTARKATAPTETPGVILMSMANGTQVVELDDDFSMPGGSRRGRHHQENEYDILVKNAIATGKPFAAKHDSDEDAKRYEASLRNAGSRYGRNNNVKVTIAVRKDQRPDSKYLDFHIYSVGLKAPAAATPEATVES